MATVLDVRGVHKYDRTLSLESQALQSREWPEL
jgi:hypothetical protein